MAKMVWTIGWKILNPDRSSLWTSSQADLQNYSKRYEPLTTVERRPEAGPLAVFDDENHAKTYLNLVQRTADKNECPQWKDAVLVRCLFIKSEDRRFYTPTMDPKPRGKAWGSEFAEAVICLE